MKIIFTVDSPLTAEEVATARASVQNVIKYRIFIMLLSLTAAGLLTFLFWTYVWPVAEGYIRSHVQFFLVVALIPITGCAMIFISTICLAAGVMRPYIATYTLTNPLEPWKAKHALELAGQFQELEVYRQAVVSCRTFLEGDYEAMTAFADKARERSVARQVIEKNAAALAKLNVIDHKLRCCSCDEVFNDSEFDGESGCPRCGGMTFDTFNPKPLNT